LNYYTPMGTKNIQNNQQIIEFLPEQMLINEYPKIDLQKLDELSSILSKNITLFSKNSKPTNSKFHRLVREMDENLIKIRKPLENMKEAIESMNDALEKFKVLP